MPSDASRPHSSGRVDVVLPKRFKQALIWLCLPILFAVVQEINPRDTQRDVRLSISSKGKHAVVHSLFRGLKARCEAFAVLCIHVFIFLGECLTLLHRGLFVLLCKLAACRWAICIHFAEPYG